MSYNVYQTKAMVLGTRSIREANKLAILYTQDFGLVYAGAQSIRENHAKMKHHLQHLAVVDIDLVRGREFWKLVGIHENLPSLSLALTSWYPFLDRLASLLIRLCPGEEPNIELWDELWHLYRLVQKDVLWNQDIELLALIRIMHHLGYWSGDNRIIEAENPYQDQVFHEYLVAHRRVLLRSLNEAIRSSQL